MQRHISVCLLGWRVCETAADEWWGTWMSACCRQVGSRRAHKIYVTLWCSARTRQRTHASESWGINHNYWSYRHLLVWPLRATQHRELLLPTLAEWHSQNSFTCGSPVAKRDRAGTQSWCILRAQPRASVSAQRREKGRSLCVLALSQWPG